MSTHLTYLGAVYRLAGEQEELVFFAKRQRFLSMARTNFKKVLLANADLLRSWANEAKSAFPDNVENQIKYWSDKVKTLAADHPVSKLVTSYGPALHHPQTELKSAINKLNAKKKDMSGYAFKEELRKINTEHQLDRATVERELLARLAVFALGDWNDAGFTEFFGSPTGEKVVDPENNTAYNVWDTSKGLVSYLVEPKKARQVTSPMNPLFRKFPHMEQLFTEFFPKPVVLSVTADNILREELSVYGNKVKDEIHKTSVMSKTLASWNTLIAALNRDMVSKNEFLRLTAIATSVVVHTGIRPALSGDSLLRNATDDMPEFEFIDDTGGDRRVKTIGAAGLKASHVEILRKDLATLKFVGKYTTTNVAVINDEVVVKALDALLSQAKVLADGTTGNVFTLNDGGQVNDDHINDYLKEVLNQPRGNVQVVNPKTGKLEAYKPITAYSFRRLIATQTFYDSLMDRKAQLAARLRAANIELGKNVRGKAVKAIEQQIADMIRDVIAQAADDARLRMSHEEATEFRHVIGNYISHRVILEFLSKNGVMRSMQEIVDDGYSVELKFKPIEFFNALMAEFPVTASFVSAWQSQSPRTDIGIVAVRGPRMFPFAPKELLAWAEGRIKTVNWVDMGVDMDVPSRASEPEVMQMAANVEEAQRSPDRIQSMQSRYLMFRGSVYRLAFDFGGLMGESESVRFDAAHKTLKRQFQQLVELYPQAQARYKKFRPVLLKLNPNLENWLADGEAGTFSSSRFKALHGASIRLLTDYIRRLKSMGQTAKTDDPQQLQAVGAALTDLAKQISAEGDAILKGESWLNSAKTFNARLQQLVDYYNVEAKSSSNPENVANHGKYVKLMKSTGQNKDQPMDDLSKMVRTLSGVVNSGLTLLKLYSKLAETVGKKFQKSSGKLVQRQFTQELFNPESTQQEPEAHKQRARAHVVRVRKPN